MLGLSHGVIDSIEELKTRASLPGGAVVYGKGIAIDPNSRKIYLAGAFATYNGTSRNNIVRLNTDGSLDTTFDPGTGFNGLILVIRLDSSGNIYAGGTFTTFTGATNNGIIKLLPSGKKDTSFDNSTGFATATRVDDIAIDANGDIYCCGTFTSYKGTTANRIIRLNSDGTKDTGFDNSTGFNAQTRCLAIDGNGDLYVGGDFTTYKGTTYQRIIRLNTDGSIDTGFDSTTGFGTAGNYIVKITIDGNGDLYVAGGFTAYKGTTANRIIRLNTDGTKDTGFDNSTGFNGETDNVVIDRYGQLYVTGAFTQYKSNTNNRAIKLNTDGSVDSSFDNTTGFNSGTVLSTIYDDYNHRLLCGGTFTQWKGVSEVSFTRLNLNGNSDTL